MRKKFLSGSALLFILFITIYGCKKTIKEESIPKPPTQNQSAQGSTNHDQAIEDITVSEYGFLVFPTTADLDGYIKMALTYTHAEMQAYLTNKEFNSLGATLYGEDFQDKPITEEEAMDYVFDVNRIFRVDHVIMKPIVPWTGCSNPGWQFLLTMSPDNLNSTSYDYLAAGSYNSEYMSKIATNSEPSGGLFDFVTSNPTGYEDTDPTSCPETTAEKPGRFLGTGWTNTGPHTWNDNPYSTGCPCGGWSTTNYYTILWISTGIEESGYICKKGCL
jgi:hypothetical protein